MDFLNAFLGTFAGCFVFFSLVFGILYMIFKPSKAKVEHRNMLNEDIREMETDAGYQNFREQTKSWQ